jgi:hypothetical protein
LLPASFMLSGNLLQNMQPNTDGLLLYPWYAGTQNKILSESIINEDGDQIVVGEIKKMDK